MKMKRVFIVFVYIFFLLCLIAGCLSLPEKKTGNRSLIILSVQIQTLIPDNVLIYRVDSQGQILESYGQDIRKDGYFLFTNLPEGRYVIGEARSILEYYAGEQFRFELRPVQLEEVIWQEDVIERYILKIDFSDDLKEKFSVIIKNQGVYYMGHFSGRLMGKGIFSEHTVSDVKGLRTQRGRSLAFEFLENNWPDSTWLNLERQ